MTPMLIKKSFYFARHGQTEWNKQQLCQGHQDIELNEAGRQEAMQDLDFCIAELKKQ